MALDRFVAAGICGFAKVLTGVRALWQGRPDFSRRRIYFANHRSHGDFVLIWSSLPPEVRRATRPVAGADYWLKGGLRRYIINKVFRGVLVDRQGGGDPVGQMAQALTGGDSLIMFPEGTRNLTDDLLPFKSGLFHLARTVPDIDLVPVWIQNLGRAMPKGSNIPLPLLCTLTFGTPIQLREGEDKAAFLARARSALLALAPPEE